MQSYDIKSQRIKSMTIHFMTVHFNMNFQVSKGVTTFIFRKTRMYSNRAISLLASPIIVAKKYDFLAL